MSLHIGMVYDLRSAYLLEGYSEEQVAEFDSDETVDAIADAIVKIGHCPEMIGHGRDLCRRLSNGDRWDLVFNIAEGMTGRNREAQVPALLEMFNQAYTLSDPMVCSITLDKGMTKRIVAAAGLHTPKFRIVSEPEDLENFDLPFPVFAKPVAEGTGKGVDGCSRITSREALTRACKKIMDELGQAALVETYLPGREFTTGILGNGRNAKILGTLEVYIRPEAPSRDYTYEIKERCEEFVEYRSVPHDTLREEIENLALNAFQVLECRDAGRVDIRLDDTGQPAFIEINPLPGLHPTHSDLPMIAAREAMPYHQLIGEIIDAALTRNRIVSPRVS